VTWELGDLRATAQSAAFEVRIPQPVDPTFVDGVFTQVFANTASMGWTDTTRGPQVLPSNQVTVKASVEVLPAEAVVPPPVVQPEHQAPPPAIQGVEAVLPDTGGPAGAAGLVGAGALAVVLGSWLLLAGRRRTG
jgi:LPXTG-motif cell wall-anchored protein